MTQLEVDLKYEQMIEGHESMLRTESQGHTEVVVYDETGASEGSLSEARRTHAVRQSVPFIVSIFSLING